jgi:transposase
MRFGIDYRDPGADQYERQHRERVVKQLHRRAVQFGFTLQKQTRADPGRISLSVFLRNSG